MTQRDKRRVDDLVTQWQRLSKNERRFLNKMDRRKPDGEELSPYDEANLARIERRFGWTVQS